MSRVPRALSLILVPTFLTTGCALEQPFSGPGYDNGALTTDAAGPFIVVATHLDVKDDADADAAFSAHMEALQKALPEQPGLVGSALSGVPLSNDEQRTLSAWESEEAMLAWVVSDVHAKAMQDMATRSEGGRTVSWTLTRDEMPPTWEDARKRLDEDGREAY